MRVLIAALVIGALMVGLALMVGVVAGPIVAQAGDKVHICHRDQGHPEWKEIEIAESALEAHLNHQWGADIYPVPDGGCPSNDPTATYTPEPPTSTPTNTQEVPTETSTPTATGTLEPTETPELPPPPETPCGDGCYVGLG